MPSKEELGKELLQSLAETTECATFFMCDKCKQYVKYNYTYLDLSDYYLQEFLSKVLSFLLGVLVTLLAVKGTLIVIRLITATG